MSTKHFLKLSTLAAFFDTKQLQRGENAAESGHVIEMNPNFNQTPALIRGKVSASMRNKTYDVEILIDKEDGIVGAKCACPRGRVSCHHMAALCIYARDNVSITDTQCQWNVPARRNEPLTCQTLADLYPPRRAGYVACATEVTEGDVEQLRESLASFDNVVGFTWLLNPEPTDENLPIVKSIQDILFSEEYISSTNKVECFTKMAQLSEEDIQFIVKTTIGQSSNANWLIARKHRLTASHFGQVLSACRRNRYPQSLFKSLLNEYNLEGVRAIRWGKENEPLAVKHLEDTLTLIVTPTGLWLDACGYLGATPDGLVGDNAIVEVKCPFRFRDTSLKEFLKNQNDYILFEKDGNYQINKQHDYYHQIQGQLMFTKCSLCYLVLWTPTDKIIHLVEKEENWSTNINILKEFFYSQFLLYLINQ